MNNKIKMQSERWIDGSQVPSIIREVSIFEAIQLFVSDMFNQTAYLQEFSKTKVVIGTRFFNSSDRITYEGNEKDIKSLVLIVAIGVRWGSIQNIVAGASALSDEIIASLKEQQRAAIEFQKDSYKARRKVRVYLALGRVTEHNDQFYGKNVREADLLAAALLVEETDGENMQAAFEWAKPLKYDLGGKVIGF